MYVNWDLTRDLYDEENFKKDFYYAKVKRSKAKKMDVRITIHENLISETILLLETLLGYLYSLNPNPKYLVDSITVLSQTSHFEIKPIPEFQRIMDYLTPRGIKLYILDFSHNQRNEYSLIIEGNKALLPLCRKVKRWKASPLEKIMVLYSYVGLFPYKNNKRDYRATREWARFVLNGYGVCVGYIDVFMRMMEYVFEEKTNYCDIVHMNVIGEQEVILHAAGTIHVVDRKYGINGIYHIDPTWDNIKSLDDGIAFFLIPYEVLTGSYNIELAAFDQWQHYSFGDGDVESYFPFSISTFERRMYKGDIKKFFDHIHKLSKNSKPISDEIVQSLFERLGEFYKLDDPKAFAKRKWENTIAHIEEYR